MIIPSGNGGERAHRSSAWQQTLQPAVHETLCFFQMVGSDPLQPRGMVGSQKGTVLAIGDGMTSVSDMGSQSSQAFTVLIPRGLQGSVDGLPQDVRQALLSELFRMASLAHQERSLLQASSPYALNLDLDGCHAIVEMDPSRSRLTLAGLTRARALG